MTKHINAKTFAAIICTAAFICLYSYALPYGFITIDPSSATPSRNFTIGFILAALFPVALGILTYFLFAYKNVFCVKSLFKSAVLSAVWLLSAFVFLGIELPVLWKFIEQTDSVIPYLVKRGSYNDLEMTNLLLSLLYAIDAIFAGLIIYPITKNKLKNKNIPGV